MNNRPARYMMSSARLKEDGGKLVVRPNMPAWINPVFSAGLFLLLTVFLWSADSDNLLFGVILLSMAFVMFSAYPMSVAAIFDLSARRLHYMADYLVRMPRRVEIDVPLSQIVSVGYRPVLFNKQGMVEILLTDGNRILLEFGKRADESARLMETLKSLGGGADSPRLSAPEAIKSAEVAEATSLMQRELRSWSFTLLFIGVAQLIAAGGFSSWGLLLIGLGLASFYFREAPMFIIYAVTVARAGLDNVFSGNTIWIGFGLMQGYWTYQLVQQFRRFQRAEAAEAAQRGVNLQLSRTGQAFPMLSIFLGIGGFAGYLLSVGGFIFLGALQNQTLLPAMDWLMVLSVYCGLIGLGAGIASGMSRYDSKPAWVAGIVLSSLTLLADLGLRILSML